MSDLLTRSRDSPKSVQVDVFKQPPLSIYSRQSTLIFQNKVGTRQDNCFPTIFAKGNNFGFFLLISLVEKALLKVGLFLQEKNVTSTDENEMAEWLPLNVYHFTSGLF